MSAKRKNNPNQPELPMDSMAPGTTGEPQPAAAPSASVGEAAKPKPARNGKPEAAKAKPGGNGNGAAHVLAESVAAPVALRPFVPGKIELPLHRRVNRSF